MVVYEIYNVWAIGKSYRVFVKGQGVFKGRG